MPCSFKVMKFAGGVWRAQFITKLCCGSYQTNISSLYVAQNGHFLSVVGFYYSCQQIWQWEIYLGENFHQLQNIKHILSPRVSGDPLNKARIADRIERHTPSLKIVKIVHYRLQAKPDLGSLAKDKPCYHILNVLNLVHGRGLFDFFFRLWSWKYITQMMENEKQEI